jgi:hypothetical protein
MRLYGGVTVYWSKGRSARNLALYADKPARTKTTDTPCAHLELRFSNTGAVRRAGFDEIESLIDLEMLSLLPRYIKMLDFDFDAFISRLVKRTCAAERARFMKRRRTHVHPAVEQYRTHLTSKIKHILKKLGLDTAQGFKDRDPRKAKRLTAMQVVQVMNDTHDPSSQSFPVLSMPPIPNDDGQTGRNTDLVLKV